MFLANSKKRFTTKKKKFWSNSSIYYYVFFLWKKTFFDLKKMMWFVRIMIFFVFVCILNWNDVIIFHFFLYFFILVVQNDYIRVFFSVVAVLYGGEKMKIQILAIASFVINHYTTPATHLKYFILLLLFFCKNNTLVAE
mgnify:CR=1 FL=1